MWSLTIYSVLFNAVNSACCANQRISQRFGHRGEKAWYASCSKRNMHRMLWHNTIYQHRMALHIPDLQNFMRQSWSEGGVGYERRIAQGWILCFGSHFRFSVLLSVGSIPAVNNTYWEYKVTWPKHRRIAQGWVSVLLVFWSHFRFCVVRGFNSIPTVLFTIINQKVQNVKGIFVAQNPIISSPWGQLL